MVSWVLVGFTSDSLQIFYGIGLRIFGKKIEWCLVVVMESLPTGASSHITFADLFILFHRSQGGLSLKIHPLTMLASQGNISLFILHQ